MNIPLTRGFFLSLFVLIGSLLALHQKESAFKKTSSYRHQSDRLQAVQTFADLLLEHGRDTYRDQHTPLFVDGLRVADLTAATWVHEGNTWIPSNLANQQNLLRTLVGLSNLTGDDKYKLAAGSALSYGFENLQHPNGLLYWGGHRFLDLASGEHVGEGYRHEFKFTLPYYELMHEVNPIATERFIRAFWNAHVMDWSNLDMNRHGDYEDTMGDLWNNKFIKGTPFFEGDGLTFINAGTDLIYAGLMLYDFTGEQGAYDWSMRLAGQYVQARHPKTGLGVYQYSKPIRRDTPPATGPLPTTSNYGDRAENQFAAEFGDVALEGYMLRNPGAIYGNNAIIQLQMAEKLGNKGTDLLEWTISGMKAWAKYGYDPKKNLAKPIWADGTDLTDYAIKRDGYFGKDGTVFSSATVPTLLFWSYALAYRLSGDAELWAAFRQMAIGYGLGDVGESPGQGMELAHDASFSDPMVIFALLEVSQITDHQGYLDLAVLIGDNILKQRIHNGLFVPSKSHSFASVNAIEPLALLSLEAMVQGDLTLVPKYNGGSGYFHGPHDGFGRTTDRVVLWDAKE
ncbi:pectate lyase [Lunatibacter salilacus]|uniref:pectate lyase n=1 Tax=Lunatibacter salilacus TaxID=2483804 RepID=UPI00131DE454|nr:pectate lyase [Lunatibacter salilacus]